MSPIVKTFKSQPQIAPDAIIMFSASWCPNCTKMYPIFIKISNNYPNGHFYYIDVDEFAVFSASYHVKNIPTFVFKSNNTEIQRIVGADPKYLEATVKLYYQNEKETQKKHAKEEAAIRRQERPPRQSCWKTIASYKLNIILLVCVAVIISAIVYCVELRVFDKFDNKHKQ